MLIPKAVQSIAMRLPLSASVAQAIARLVLRATTNSGSGMFATATSIQRIQSCYRSTWEGVRLNLGVYRHAARWSGAGRRCLGRTDAPTDWKLYAFTVPPRVTALFYLNSEIVRTPEGHVQAWTKSLDLERFQKANLAVRPMDDAFKSTVALIAGSYKPPMSRLTKMDTDDNV